MSDFVAAWRAGALLEAPELMALGREFILAVAETLLARVGRELPAAERAALRHRAYEKYLTGPGRMRYYTESPLHQGPNKDYTLYFKSFAQGFQPFERLTVTPWPATGNKPWVLSLRLQYEQEDGRYRAGALLLGVEPWAVSPPVSSRERRRFLVGLMDAAGVPAAVERAWAPAGLTPAWQENGTLFGWHQGPGEWPGEQGALVEHCAHLLAGLWQHVPPAPPGHLRVAPPDPGGRGEGAGDGPGPDPGRPVTAARISALLGGRGYRFDPEQVATFCGALKTKGLVILAGLSGTGKTRLAQELARLLGLDDGRRFLLQPVRPDWRDGTALLGYHNPLTGRYQSTAFLRLLLGALDEYRSAGARALPYLVVLEELNLARVEYYFADLLSVLESGRQASAAAAGLTAGAVCLHGQPAPVAGESGLPIPPALHLPPNLYFVGTVNMDETTFSLSPKVLDRAFTLEFGTMDLAGYPPADAPAGGAAPDLGPAERQALLDDLTAGGQFPGVTKAAVRAAGARFPHLLPALDRLHGALEPHDLHFGYRVVDEILAFTAAVAGSPAAWRRRPPLTPRCA